MDEVAGLEPAIQDSKSYVLPLHYTSICRLLNYVDICNEKPAHAGSLQKLNFESKLPTLIIFLIIPNNLAPF